MYPMDETQRRLLAWADGHHSERLAAQVLSEEGYKDIDPSHPYGGKDGGRDITCTRDGRKWIAAVYFPRGDLSYAKVERKLVDDLQGALTHEPEGIVFITNQELTLSERAKLAGVIPDGIDFDLFHMERIATILDRPHMHPIREQFLRIPVGRPPLDIRLEVGGTAHCFTASTHVRDVLIKQQSAEIRKRAEKSSEALGTASRGIRDLTEPVGLFDHRQFMANFFEPTRPTYLSHAEADRQISALSKRIHAQWSRSEQIIAERAFGAVGFTVTNLAESFLKNVKMVITFHGVQGLEPETDTTDFTALVEDPDYEPADMFIRMAGRNYLPKRMGNDPVQFRQVGDDLEVTLTIEYLRPQPDRWESEDAELVVFAPGPEPVAMTWYATAEDYPRSLECRLNEDGTPIELPVIQVDAAEAYVRLADAELDV